MELQVTAPLCTHLLIWKAGDRAQWLEHWPAVRNVVSSCVWKACRWCPAETIVRKGLQALSSDHGGPIIIWADCPHSTNPPFLKTYYSFQKVSETSGR